MEKDMEEDIKILEERVITLKRHIKNYEESNCKTDVYQQLVKECDAIVNVLHDLKYNKAQFETQLREKLDLQASSIPKSKIKEKIEELEYYFKTQYRSEIAKKQTWTYEEILCQKIKLLQELMEDK